MKKLPIFATLKEGFELGMVNCFSLIAATILYILTIWVPYINVGTTLAMAALPVEMAKGNVINPLCIFDSKYRKNMGEFFILMALMTGAIWAGFMFMLIPGIVIAIAWNFAFMLFVDKDLNSLECLRESNRMTYGNKGRIFWITILLSLIYCVILGALCSLFTLDNSALEIVAIILIVIISLLLVPAAYGVDAAMYKALLDDPQAAAPAATDPKAE